MLGISRKIGQRRLLRHSSHLLRLTVIGAAAIKGNSTTEHLVLRVGIHCCCGAHHCIESHLVPQSTSQTTATTQLSSHLHLLLLLSTVHSWHCTAHLMLPKHPHAAIHHHHLLHLLNLLLLLLHHLHHHSVLLDGSLLLLQKYLAFGFSHLNATLNICCLSRCCCGSLVRDGSRWLLGSRLLFLGNDFLLPRYSCSCC